MKNSQSIQGWLLAKEAESLKKFALEQQERSDCDLLEIGPWKGRSTLAIASVLTGDHRLWTIDHFCGSPEHQRGQRFYRSPRYTRRGGLWIYPELIENIVAFDMQDKVIVLPLDSKLAAYVVDDNFCFVYIDGDHSYEGISADWNLWSSHLEIGGVCLFHDCFYAPIKRLLDILKRSEDLEIAGQVKNLLAFRKIR